MPGFYIKILGDKVVTEHLDEMGLRAVRAKPAMAKIAAYLMEVMASVFESQGRRGGGSWRPITDEWAARKAAAGLDPRILHATLALRRSMSVPEAAHQILDVGMNRVVLGTDLPYAEKQDIDRPFSTKILPRDRLVMREIVTEYITRPMRRR